MIHPVTDDGRAELLRCGRILRVNAPVRETPEVETGGSGVRTVTRAVYAVDTEPGSRLYLRAAPNGKKLGAYARDTQVALLEAVEAHGWWRVAVVQGGARGYMHSAYLRFVGNRTEVIGDDTPGEVIRPRRTREQLFRICSVTRDLAHRTVLVRARHISYDLLGCIAAGACSVNGLPAADAVAQCMALADHDTGMNVYCTVRTPVTGEYGGRNLIDCLLNGKDGIVTQTGAKLVRDNFDLFIVPDAVRDCGVCLRGDVDLVQAVLCEDAGDVYTRIRPVGRKANGDELTIDGVFVESPRAAFPVRAITIEYPVKAGPALSESAAKALLARFAAAEFAEKGLDRPRIALQADFLQDGSLHLYDTVRVLAPGFDVRARLTGYLYDVLKDRYTDAELSAAGEEEGNGC